MRILGLKIPHGVVGTNLGPSKDTSSPVESDWLSLRKDFEGREEITIF